MHRGHPLEMATMVGMSQGTSVEHEHDPPTGNITLIFQGRNELVLSCTRRGFDILAEAVRTADGILATADAESPDIEDEDG